MTNVAEQNAAMLDAIKTVGSTYHVRKYAGAWVPVAVVGGKRKTFAHCSTSSGAMGIAIRECAKASGWDGA